MTVNFSVLKGKTLYAVKGLLEGSDEVIFKCTDGSSYRMLHHQDCCETVSIVDVVGDVSDLLGEEILSAEEVSGETPSGYFHSYEPESYTWTFYTLATRLGYVDIRWLGESNGYYSEEVNFEQIN